MRFYKAPYRTGFIMLWSGAIADIPGGWHLCDGNEGTPNLTSRFVLGSGAFYDPDDVGGETQHRHPFTSNPHMHGIPSGFDIASGANWASYASSQSVTGDTDFHEAYPSYYSLAYIMKL